jgi:chromosome partitioning protein
MLNNEKVVEFFQKNPALSISMIEKEAELPKSTLSKALAGTRLLNEKHLSALEPVIVRYGYMPNKHTKAKVISVVNHKGGVGKTTSTINVGKGLHKLGYKVLLIDMDPQGNLSQSLGIEEINKQVVHALLNNEPLPIYPITEGYDLSPSDLELAYADLELVQAIGGVNQLRNILAPLKEKYDFILIDCPPALNIFTNSALVASNSCLVTLQPEASAMKGVSNLFDRIFQVRDRINYDLKVEGIVLTMVDKRLKVHRDMIEYIKKTLGNFPIFNTEIRQNVAIKESQIAQQDIFTYSENSNGADDYLKLTKEILGFK